MFCPMIIKNEGRPYTYDQGKMTTFFVLLYQKLFPAVSLRLTAIINQKMTYFRAHMEKLIKISIYTDS